MKVAILGNGLLGSTLAEVLPDATVLGHADIEVTNRESVKRALTDFDVCVNTVAMHRLPACEADPMLARLVNTEGARYVAETVPTVYISTDYVFNDDGPHDEALPGADPRSVYGRTKLGGELATLENDGIVVRVSALFGHHRSHKGPSFPDMISSSFDAIRLPADQRFSPTYAPDAARRIADLAHGLVADWTMAPLGDDPDSEPTQGIYHAANAGTTTWVEWAAQVCEVLPWQRHVESFNAHDKLRPGHSAIRSTRLPPLRHWRFALDAWADRRRKELYVSPLRSR